MLDDPDQMTPQQRLDEIAAILAVGILRIRRHPSMARPPEPPDMNSERNSLEVFGQTPLHGADGLTPARANEGSDA